jgi:hypothetical protein
VREQLESVFFEANERVQRERENSGSRRTHRGKRSRRSAA